MLLIPIQIAICKPLDAEKGNRDNGEHSFYGTYNGTWVTFNFDSTNGEISNFTWNNIQLFISIVVENFTLHRLEVKDKGLEADGSEMKLEISNDEDAKIEWKAKQDLNATISLPNNVTINTLENRTLFLDWGAANGTLEIGWGGNMSVVNSTIYCYIIGNTNLEFKLKDDDDDDKDDDDDDDDKNKKTTKPISGNFTGDFISFEYNLSADELKNISIYKVKIFNRLLIMNGTFYRQMVSKHLFKGEGNGTEKLLVHDNTITLIQIKAKENLTVILNYTNNWTLNKTNGEVILTNNNMSVIFQLAAKPVSNFGNITNSSISVFLGKESMLKIHLINIGDIVSKKDLPGNFWVADTQPILSNNLANGIVGGSVTITGSYEVPNIYTETCLEDFALEVEKIENCEISLFLSSDNPSGKFVIVSALKETLEIPTETEVQILLDGESVPEVDDISQLANETAAYYRTYDVEGEQILISVPHSSDHKILLKFIPEIESDSKEPARSWDYWYFASIIIILLIILFAGAHLYSLRKKN